MGRYIALTVSGKDIRDNKLTDCIPSRKQGESLRLAGRIGDHGELFDPTVRFPNEVEQRAMLGLALSTGVYKVISYHFYNFKGKTYKQGAGGAIGTEIAGEISKVYMNRWDQKLVRRLKLLGIMVQLYKRYVDDTLILFDTLKPGVIYDPCANKLKHCPDQEVRDEVVSQDVRNMRVVLEVANSLDKDIQLTAETPSQNASGKLPCLDLEVWLNENQEIMFQFYSKPMTNPYVVFHRSTVSPSVNRTTMFQEAMRRIRNCHGSRSRATLIGSPGNS